MTERWDREAARQTYAMPYWSEGYFDIDDGGRVLACPQGTGGPVAALADVVAAARAEGLRLPLLLRFPEILQHRRGALQRAFAVAMQAHGYGGGYTAVYPIKVNQQRSVAGALAAGGAPPGFGLEAGSKPELLAVLGIAKPGSLVVCNGYKDAEYVRLALIGRRMGLDVVIVIEKPSELEHVLHEAQQLGVAPLLGVRMRLATLGAGKWQNTGGEKGKFGLTPRQLLDLLSRLRAAGHSDALKLLHFHMGSQLSNLRDIAAGMREAVQYLAQLASAGIVLRWLDVGGGLGVDYEGTRSRSACSINYALDQYAQAIVQPLAELCAAAGLAPPCIVTEAGRAMSAHHAVLITNVSEVEPAPCGAHAAPTADAPPVLRHLHALHAELDRRPPTELYLEAQQHHTEGLALFALGQLDLAQRAQLDDLFHALAHAVRRRLDAQERAQRALLDELDEKLVDKYFVNFSVFESIPDVWAIDQIFPIVPIAGLERKPERRGVIADLTCDSDGRIDHYVDAGGVDVSLPLHAPVQGVPYLLGVFLVGAYQETLGDIHNLFGDTDAVNVQVDAAGRIALSHQRRGDSAALMLEYVGYDLDALRATWRERLAGAGLEAAQAAPLLTALQDGIDGYTYLDAGPAAT